MAMMVASVYALVPYEMEAYGQTTFDVYEAETVPTLDGIVQEGEYGIPIDIFNLGERNLYVSCDLELSEAEMQELFSDDITVYMTYDDSYLYLAVTCIDQSHMTPLSGTGIWDGDYMEFDIMLPRNDFSQHSNRMCFALGIDNNGGICGFFDKVPDYSDGSYAGVVWQDQKNNAMVTRNGNLTTYETKFAWKGILGINEAPDVALGYVQLCVSSEELAPQSEYEAYLGYIQNTPRLDDATIAEIEALGGSQKFVYNILNFAGKAPEIDHAIEPDAMEPDMEKETQIPVTSDAGIVAAAAVMAVAAGVVLTKKH